MKNTLDRRIDGPSAATRWWLCALIAISLPFGLASMLLAQPVLLQSVLATEASVPSPSKLVLTFNGRVVTHLSSVMIVGGPRNTQVLLSLPGGPDTDTLVYALPALAPGQYRAEWKARAVDGRVTDGIVRFTVIEAPR